MTVDTHKPDQSVTDWLPAMNYLEEGNKRFREGRPLARAVMSEDREILRRGQNPFAVILTCSDSRVSPEIFFDQGLGDLFVIRNAGNVAVPMVLGSIEYAVQYLNVPLVAVVGHSNCVAVAAALGGDEYSENLQSIMSAIRPAVKGCKDVDDAIRANIGHSVVKIRENEVVKRAGTTVVGAYYDLETGAVTFS